MEGKGGFQRPPTSMPSTTSRQRCPEASPGYVRAVARSSTRKAAPAVRPLSRRRRPIQASCSEGRHQCGVNGKLHTAPQRQPFAMTSMRLSSWRTGTTLRSYGPVCESSRAAEEASSSRNKVCWQKPSTAWDAARCQPRVLSSCGSHRPRVVSISAPDKPQPGDT